MAEYVRRRTDDQKEVEMATELVAMVNECLLSDLVEKLYPLARLFVAYMPK